jgi:two-component sensor histidine kinase
LKFTASPSCKLIFGRGPGDAFTFSDLVASVQRTDQKRLKDAISVAIRSKGDIDIELCLAGTNPLHQRIRFRGCVVNDERPRLVAICAAEHRQNSAQQRHALTSDKLTRELNHRLRNIFPVILTIVKHTATRHPQAAEYRHALEQRLRALAATAGLINRTGADSIDIEDLIRLELAPFQEGDNILFSGPTVWIQRALAQDFAIVVHELTTNAAKHGALSNMQGRLSVNWKLVPDTDGNSSLALEWVEQHGPKTAPPKNFGFGMMVVGESGSLLGGTASVDFASEGLRYRLSIPAERLRSVNGKGR